MTPEDKTAWLKKHGTVIYSYMDNGANAYEGRWTSRTGIFIERKGYGEKDVNDKLFDEVKLCLFDLCTDGAVYGLFKGCV